MTRLLSAFALLLIAAPSFAEAANSAEDTVRETVERFHAALVAGDGDAAMNLLSADVLVLESGDIETREEYLKNHLAADIEFARAMKSEQKPVRITIQGDVAWASARSSASGRFRDRDLNVQGAELMVLAREKTGWRIRAIHWSSRSR